MAFTWASHATDSTGNTLYITKCIWADTLGLFVAVGTPYGGVDTHRIFTSPTGVIWTLRDSNAAMNWESVAWSHSLGLLVAISNASSVTNVLTTSSDGLTWTKHNIAAVGGYAFQDIVWADTLGMFVASGPNGAPYIATSTDGTTWIAAAVTPAGGYAINSLVWTGTLLVGTGTAGAVWTSTNGTNWTARTAIHSGVGSDFHGLAYSSTLGLFAAIGTDNNIYTTTDPTSVSWTAWSGAPVGWTGSNNQIIWAGSAFLAGVTTSDNKSILSSTNGSTWALQSTGTAGSWDAPGYSPSLGKAAFFDTTPVDQVNLGSGTSDGISPAIGNAGDTVTITSAGGNGGFNYVSPQNNIVYFYDPSAYGPYTPASKILGTLNGANQSDVLSGQFTVVSANSITGCIVPSRGAWVNPPAVVGVLVVNGRAGIPSPDIVCYLPAGFTYYTMWTDDTKIVTQSLAPGPGWNLFTDLLFIIYITPTSGSSLGGDTVQIVGTGISQGATVTFGGNTAAIQSISGYPLVSLLCTTPAHAAGKVDVVVTNPNTKSTTLTGGFTYTNPPATILRILPTFGTTTGGDALTIKGTGFVSPVTVLVGNLYGLLPTVADSETITCFTPVHTKGTFDIRVISS